MRGFNRLRAGRIIGRESHIVKREISGGGELSGDHFQVFGVRRHGRLRELSGFGNGIVLRFGQGQQRRHRGAPFIFDFHALIQTEDIFLRKAVKFGCDFGAFERPHGVAGQIHTGAGDTGATERSVGVGLEQDGDKERIRRGIGISGAGPASVFVNISVIGGEIGFPERLTVI